MEVHYFSLFHGTSSWNHPNKRMPCNAIYLVHEGDGEICDAKRSSPLKAGMAYLLPSGCVVSVRCESRIVKHWGFFSIGLPPLPDLLDGLEGFHELGDFTRLWQYDPTEHADLNGLGYNWFLQGVILQLLSRLSVDLDARLLRRREEQEAFQLVFERISTEPGFSLRSGDLARLIGLSPSHFSRRFKRETGMSVKQAIAYQINLRAVRLLGRPELSIREIARELYCEDEYYFMRFFKKYHGMTPTEFRAQLGLGSGEKGKANTGVRD
ncbi:MAG: helix-turn-helix transcriptional regulator [Planctomycetes bacterium]|nr:helix-turn-helix transcriptional regulator [Planctomycetota bacterium]